MPTLEQFLLLGSQGERTMEAAKVLLMRGWEGSRCVPISASAQIRGDKLLTISAAFCFTAALADL